MVIFRYIARQLTITLTAVTSVLLFIIVGSRFIKYLAEAASGKIAADALLTIMVLRLPGFLELLLPLSLFLSILLVYGRMYMDHEIVILSQAGVSPRKLLVMTVAYSLSVLLIVAIFSLIISPLGAAKTEKLLSEQKQLAQFSLLIPGRFQTLKSKRVVYVESLAEDRKTMQGVFITEQKKTKDRNTGKVKEQQITIWADTGMQTINEETGVPELTLVNGRRYLGIPGEADYQIIRFDKLMIKLDKNIRLPERKQEAMATRELLAQPSQENWVEFQWRLSIVFSVIVVCCLAVPLSRINPRQGRFVYVLPAIFIYLAYLAAQILAREALNDGKIPLIWGFWWIHAIFLMIAWLMTKFNRRFL